MTTFLQGKMDGELLWERPGAPDRIDVSVVTIGNFDGVHRGHRSVIDHVITRAKRLGARSVLVTFDPHPARVLRPESAPKLITPTAEKLRLLEATGLDRILILPFTKELAATSAHDFARDLLQKRLQAIEVHEGESFRFGYHAEGTMNSLAELGSTMGFKVFGHTPLELARGIVSSSRIRSAVAMGDLTTTRHLLGRSFFVRSTPARGRGYGSRYAVPTINLAAYTELLPANGVYVTELHIGEGANASCFEGVTNVGNRPTFGEDSFAVESYLFDFKPTDLSEETPLRLTFLKRLREERKWPSPEALKSQIGIDVARAKRWFHLRGRLLHLATRL